MLQFSELVSAIHVSVQRAGEALNQANYETFERYFVGTKEPVDARSVLRDALAEASSLSETGAPADVMRRLAESLEAASSALDSNTTALQPRVVAIDYPTVTKEGPVVHTVHVPLITLVPFAGIQISKLTFRADLDVQAGDDGTLRVGFAPSGSDKHPPPNQGGLGSAEGHADGAIKANTSIEIVVESTPLPDGLRKVIEGYERALRAQIPG